MLDANFKMQETLEEAWLALARAIAVRLPVPKSADDVDKPGAQWHSLDVTYQPPHVERLYTFLRHEDFVAVPGESDTERRDACAVALERIGGSVRLSLHVIYPCAGAAALFHPHPWPSSMGILHGSYRMRVGRGVADAEPLTSSWVQHCAGSFYAMCDRDDWHAVVPGSNCALTFMLNGEPWSEPRSMPNAPLQAQAELSRERVAAIVGQFQRVEGAVALG